MSERNLRCIVLLPEGNFYARLFDEILAPAISQSCYLPGLMQRISASPIPASHLLEQIDRSDMLLADLSGSTPEIWFAAGYAVASAKPLCLISSDPQFTSPVSFAPLEIIFYPEAALPSDFDVLQRTIAQQLAALSPFPAQNENLAQWEYGTQDVASVDDTFSASSLSDDLASYEVLALKLIDLKASEDGLSPRDLGMQMRDNESAHLTSHAMNSLKRRGFIERRLVHVSDGGEAFVSDNLFLTLLGEQWLHRNSKKGVSSSRDNSAGLIFQRS